MKYTLFFFLLLSLFNVNIIAQNVLIDDFLVNDDVTDTTWQFLSSIAMNGSGNFVIVWTDGRNGNYDIYCQRYHSNGVAQGINTKVNDNVGTTNNYRPSVAIDGNGNYVIVWTDGRNGNYDIYCQCYNSNGIPQGSNIKVNDDIGLSEQVVPSVAIDESGNFVIAWMDGRNGNDDVYYQQYNSSGIKQGSNTKVNDDIGNEDQRYPSIAMNGNGNFVIGWEDARDHNFDIYYQRYDSIGVIQGSNTKANDDVGTAHQFDASIAMDGSGNFVIVWDDRRNGDLDPDIYYQRYNLSGILQGSNVKVNGGGGDSVQAVPSIAIDVDGNFVVVWEDRIDSINTDIIGQRYYTDGTAREANYRIVADGPNPGEKGPAVSANNSNIIFTWTDNRRSKGLDIYAKIVGWDWDGVKSILQDGNTLPKEYTLEQNYPNPFNPFTNIRFQIKDYGFVSLKIFNLLGQEVATLVSEKLQPGEYQKQWNATGMPSGVYYYQLRAGNYVETMKLVLLR
ncbi:MAG: T9SS type A sorting domain-containing protein [Bacteroidota bacterium]|nr:T9SS type A sorting domain-containing protein [Bacteroidota bacterium]